MDQYKSGKMVKFICEGCKNTLDLEDIGFIYSILITSCVMLKMNLLSGPFFGEVKGEGDNDGISGVLLIKESHIAIHTWPRLKAVRIVVDSCKDFQYRDILKYFFRHLQPSKIVIYEENLIRNVEVEEFYFNDFLLD